MNRFEDQANYYKNYHLRYRNTIAVIHVEDEDDKKFWLIELKKIKNGEYHFITQSKNSAGTLSKYSIAHLNSMGDGMCQNSTDVSLLS